MEVSLATLRMFDELAHLHDRELGLLAKRLRKISYRAGTHICREGDEGDSCYLLIEGTVQVSKDLPDGRRVRLASLQPNVMIGQTGLVSGQKQTANVLAVTNVELLCLHREPYLWALEQGSPWALSFLQLVGVNLVRQIRTAMERLDTLAAAEDVTAELEGKSRQTGQKKQYMNLTGYTPSSGEHSTDSSEEVYSPQEEVKADPNLLSLLQSTERSLGSVSPEVTEVIFVEETGSPDEDNQ